MQRSRHGRELNGWLASEAAATTGLGSSVVVGATAGEAKSGEGWPHSSCGHGSKPLPKAAASGCHRGGAAVRRGQGGRRMAG